MRSNSLGNCILLKLAADFIDVFVISIDRLYVERYSETGMRGIPENWNDIYE